MDDTKELLMNQPRTTVVSVPIVIDFSPRFFCVISPETQGALAGIEAAVSGIASSVNKLVAS